LTGARGYQDISAQTAMGDSVVAIVTPAAAADYYYYYYYNEGTDQ